MTTPNDPTGSFATEIDRLVQRYKDLELDQTLAMAAIPCAPENPKLPIFFTGTPESMSEDINVRMTKDDTRPKYDGSRFILTLNDYIH